MTSAVLSVEDITKLNAGQFYGILAEGNNKELMGVQFEPTVSNDEPLQIEFDEVCEFDIERNYERIVQEARNLFKEEVKEDKPKKKTRNKYLNLDL